MSYLARGPNPTLGIDSKAIAARRRRAEFKARRDYFIPALNALGLTVPGMPVGSPGMEQGAEAEPYDVLLINKDGTTAVYASH